MRILIHPANPAGDAQPVSEDVRRALKILSDSFIKTEGGGTISSDGHVDGVIMISFDA